MNYDKIGDFIQSKRKEKNMTQNELAKKLGVTDKAVSKWERGLGCPDVSILEVLAKELDVSILELLKGREIENEVINVTEADDYIKESIKVTKESTKDKILNNISHVIFYLVLFITIGFTILSTMNYYSGKKGEYIEVDTELKKDYSESLEKLKSNYNIIKNNRGILTEEEQKELVENLGMYINYFENLYYPVIIDKNTKYTYNDVLLEFLYSITTLEYPSGIVGSTMNILRNHDLFDDYKKNSILYTMYQDANVENEFFMHYQKNKQDYFRFSSTNALTNFALIYTDDDYYNLSLFMEGLYRVGIERIKLYTMFTDDIIKAGGLNE